MSALLIVGSLVFALCRFRSGQRNGSPLIPAPGRLSFSYVEAMAFSPDGSALAVGSDFGHLSVANLVAQTEREIQYLPDSGNMMAAAAFSRDGKL